MLVLFMSVILSVSLPNEPSSKVSREIKAAKIIKKNRERQMILNKTKRLIESLTKDLDISESCLASIMGVSIVTFESWKSGISKQKRNRLLTLFEVVRIIKKNHPKKVYEVLLNADVSLGPDHILGDDMDDKLPIIEFINGWPDKNFPCWDERVKIAIVDYR